MKNRKRKLSVFVGLIVITLLACLVSLNAATVTYQAENVSYGGGTVTETKNSGYNGSAYLNFSATGGYAQFNNVDGGTGGVATMQIRNALSSTSSRTGRYQVNGGTWQNITFNNTGAWTTWVTTTVSVTLNSGTGNTIRLESTGQDLANIDEITVISSGSIVTPTPTQRPGTPTPTRRATPTPTSRRNTPTPSAPMTGTPTPYTGNPTVYLCGDSTCANYPASSYPQTGWGQMIPNFFTTSVKFDNRAVNGRSSKSFIDEGRLDAILSVIKPNDYLFVQFAHNDSKTDDPTRYTEPYTTYKDYLRQYVDRARQYNAIPVLITPVLRLKYTNGVFVNDFPDYCAAMKQVATEKNVKLIDLNTKCLNYLTSIGYDQAYTLYMVSSNGTDYTHFTEKGATQMARLVAEGVKEINVPISQYVK